MNCNQSDKGPHKGHNHNPDHNNSHTHGHNNSHGNSCTHSHRHGHTHGHGHLHTHGVEAASLNTAFKLGIGLNVGFVILEAIFGFVYDSMGLLSDAGHNLSDVFSLILSLVAFKLMSRTPDERHTYGFRKFSIQASLLNALLLFGAVGIILYESIGKLLHPTPVDGDAIAWVAGAGVLVNGVTAWLFLKDKERDLNVKGAFLHMLADTLVSVGVVVSGIVIHLTGWYVIDPVIGIAVALMIAWSSWGLLKESFRLSIDSVPAGIDLHQLERSMTEVEGVKGIHHLHVWAISTVENAMTVHVVIDSAERLDDTLKAIRAIATKAGIAHSTIECETVACTDTGLIAED